MGEPRKRTEARPTRDAGAAAAEICRLAQDGISRLEGQRQPPQWTAETLRSIESKAREIQQLSGQLATSGQLPRFHRVWMTIVGVTIVGGVVHAMLRDPSPVPPRPCELYNTRVAGIYADHDALGPYEPIQCTEDGQFVAPEGDAP